MAHMEALALPPHVEPKKQGQASSLQPPTLARLIAFGWSESAQFGARLRTKLSIVLGQQRARRTHLDVCPQRVFQ